MGSGIAEVAAKANFDVVVREVSDALIEAGRDRIRRSLDRAVEREKLTEADRDAAWTRLRFSTELSDLSDRHLVIEAIVEDGQAKNELFAAMDELCGPETILASNTSSLTITDMAAATGRPDRVVGLHFFSPVPVMKLVEVVRTIVTSDEAFNSAYAFAERLGKQPIVAQDNSGFVVNLLLVPYCSTPSASSSVASPRGRYRSGDDTRIGTSLGAAGSL